MLRQNESINAFAEMSPLNQLPPRLEGGLEKWKRPCPVANYGHPPAKVAGAPMESCRFVSMDATTKATVMAHTVQGHLAHKNPPPLRSLE